MLNINKMIENTLYNPASLSEEKLIENFIVRTDVFEQIFSGIKEFDVNNSKHHLIQGQRGMGKTTLLLRLKYEIERDEKLSAKVIPVFFNEESYDVNSLSTLWEKLLKYLDDYFNTGGYFYNFTETFVDKDNYEELCYDYLISKLKERGRRVILFFDNFGELFFDILKPQQKDRLYMLLSQDNSIQIIGTTAVIINDFKVREKDFTQLFILSYLKGLTSKETFNLISKLQENCSIDYKINLAKSKSKIDTLSVLTGGVIRTIMMLYQVLLDDPYGKALNDLEKILDKVTPLYKHRIEDLPLQQRKIVDVIAKKWDATSAKEIANEIREDGKRVSSKIISAQLNQLEKNNVVEKKTTNTKNNLYQIKERFFNIWYLMRNGDRRDRRRIAWLTKFLEIWYDDEDSQNMFINNHIKAIQSGNYHPSSALLVLEALAYSEVFDPLKVDDILKHTSKLFNEDEIRHLPNILNSKKLLIAFKRFMKKEYDDAIKLLNSLNDSESSKYLLLCQIYINMGRKEDALIAYSNIIKLRDADLIFYEKLSAELKMFESFFSVIESNKSRLDIKNVEYVIGEAYLDQGLHSNAQHHYLKAYSLGNNNAPIKLISIYINQKEYHEAEKLLLKGFDDDIIDIIELLNYYSLIKRDTVKLRKYLDVSPKNANYYLHLALLEANFGENETDDQEENEDLNLPYLNNLEKATELFLKEAKNGFIEDRNFTLALNLLLSSYVYQNENFLRAYDLIQKFTGKFDESFFPYLLLKAEILLMNDVVDKDLINKILNDWDFGDDDLESINNVMILLLVKSEFKFLFELFKIHDGKLKDAFRPTYYALMTFLNKEFPDEVIKMGDELKVPVEEIIEKVEELKKEYNM